MDFLSADGLVSFYSILVGISIIGFWIFFIGAKRLSKLGLVQERIEIGYHVVAEILTAVFLVAAGIGSVYSSSWGRNLSLIALGMLLYSVINSPGPYAARKNAPMIVMFSVLSVLTLIAILGLLGIV